MADPRIIAIEYAIRAAAKLLFSRGQTVAEVVAVLTVADEVPDTTPRESAAAVRQSRRECMVAELMRLEQQGRGRGAPALVAGKCASDPLDPIEVDSLARNLRRWRRKISGHCPIPLSKIS